MVFDGKKRAQDIQEELKGAVHGDAPRLAVVMVGDDAVSQSYIEKKKAFGEAISAHVIVYTFSEEFEQETLEVHIQMVIDDEDNDGVIIQLPLPKHINRKRILSMIPKEKDVDALGDAPVVPTPVVGAMQDIMEQHTIKLKDKKVVVIGEGALVGKPAYEWVKNEEADVAVVTEATENISDYTKEADIIISGAGSPGIVTPEIIKEGVVILDAGTSEEAGKVVGDADPACAEKASLFTPVPGGIGPMTVALLFKNLITLSAK